MLKTILLVTVLAALPGAAEARDVIQPSAVSSSATVAGGAARTFDLSCRGPAIALNATASGLPSGADVLRSTPGVGVRRWSLRLAAAESAARQRLSASIRCLRVALPSGITGVSLGVVTRRSPSVLVPAGATQRTSVSCKRGYIPTGYGLTRGDAELRLTEALASARGWSFRLANTGSQAAEASVTIRCARAAIEALRGGAPVSLRLETRQASFSDSVEPGRPLRHSCRPGEFSVATGVSLDQASGVELESAQPAGSRAGRWTFRGSGGRVRTQLLCLARDSTFR
jgi:hypothetical protein